MVLSRFQTFTSTNLRSPMFLVHRKRVDGKFLGPGGMVPASQAICSSLLEECFEIVQEIRAQDESKNVASSLRPIYDRLSEIRKELESLVRIAAFLALLPRSFFDCDRRFTTGTHASVEPPRDRLVELQSQSPGD